MDQGKTPWKWVQGEQDEPRERSRASDPGLGRCITLGYRGRPRSARCAPCSRSWRSTRIRCRGFALSIPERASAGASQASRHASTTAIAVASSPTEMASALDLSELRRIIESNSDREGRDREGHHPNFSPRCAIVRGDCGRR